MAGQKSNREKAADIVRDAGGQIVGRTKLQKIAYLLELAGMGDGFRFEYRHYGPYSEELADAIQMANAFGLVKELERQAEWGGVYSIYSVPGGPGNAARHPRTTFAELAAKIGAVELELAATAAYLSVIEGYKDPWGETARRKPEKANDKQLRAAREAYRILLKIPTPKPLPKIA